MIVVCQNLGAGVSLTMEHQMENQMVNGMDWRFQAYI